MAVTQLNKGVLGVASDGDVLVTNGTQPRGLAPGTAVLNERAGSLSRCPFISLAGCYAKNFGPKGFGYGQGAGALVHAQ